MSLITIDHNVCQRDGMCVAVCPLRLFEIDSEGFPVARADADRKCIACGHCVAVCSHDAIRHGNLPLENMALASDGPSIPAPAMGAFLKSRRSIRVFRQEPVPDELIAEAIDTARWAPSAVNHQPVHWLVIRTPGEVRRLAGLVIDYLRQISAQEPRYAAFVKLWEQGIDPVLRNAPHLVVVHAPDDWNWSAVDCAIALTQFELAAVASGVGTCWAGFLMRAANGHPPLKGALGIPDGHSVYGALMYGYPRFFYKRIPPRREARVEWK